jgi:ATP-dependent DNA helicase RecQ
VVKKPAERTSYTPGAAVHVAKVGKGQVVGTTDDMVIIVFPDGQTRTFLKSYVKPVRIVSESGQPPEPERAPA